MDSNDGFEPGGEAFTSTVNMYLVILATSKLQWSMYKPRRTISCIENSPGVTNRY